MPQTRANTASPRTALPRGERFAGRFDILDTAGIGAESIVYKVRDQQSGAVLALKVYEDQYGKDPKRRQAFLREVELGGRIQHHNVVRILGAGETAGHSFILMEFLNGRTLAETMQISPRLKVDEFLPVFCQMASALHCLHSHGIVHRDIKPGNLMFAADGTLKLMDFGIARRYGEAVTVGVARGTVDYAAPEQLLGREPTTASDLFALAAVAVELLTGEKPFRGMSQMERSTKAPLSIQSIMPEIPANLASAIEQALQPDPAMRPASVTALIEAAGLMDAMPPARDAAIQTAAPAARQPQPAPPPAPPPKTISLLLGDEPARPLDVLPVLASLFSILRRITDAGEAHDPVTPDTVRLRPDGTAEITRRPNPGDRDTWVISTPRYSAPELLRGEIRLGADGRVAAVLYAVGLIFYEILLGRRLFLGEFRNVMRKNSDLAWMEWQVDESLQPRPLKQVLPDLPAELSTLFERLLDKDPGKRPASFREAETAVHRLLQQSAPTEEITLPSMPEREGDDHPSGTSRPRLTTSTTVLIAIALVVALLLSAAGLAWAFGAI